METSNISDLVVCLLEGMEETAVIETFLKNQPLAFNLAKRYAYGYQQRYKGTMADVDEEDFTLEAMLGLYTAAEEFDPEKGYAFSTLATSIIQRRLNDLIRRHTARGHGAMRTELDAPLYNDAEDDEEGSAETSRSATLSLDDGNDHILKKESDTLLQAAIDAVASDNPKAKGLLTDLLHNGSEFSFRRDGEKYDLNHTEVQRLIDKYAPKIRAYLSNKGIEGYDSKGRVSDKREMRHGELLNNSRNRVRDRVLKGKSKLEPSLKA